MTFTKFSNDEKINKTAYFKSPPYLIITENQISEALQTSKQEIINKIGQRISESSGWMIESIDNHYLNVVKYKSSERIIIC